MRFLFLLFALLVLLPGCYHTTAVTGRTPGATVVERPWAMSFVYGLVPPATVDASRDCPQGVAIVETQISFLNGLVGSLTAGLVTPMTITVTCATGTAAADPPAIEVDADAPLTELQTAFADAAEQAAEDEAPVYVAFK